MRAIGRKLGPLEPARREFFPAISHVFPAEHAELEHLFRRQLGRKPWTECASHRFCTEINITLLHFVVHLHPHRFHKSLRKSGIQETELISDSAIQRSREI